MQHDDSRLRRVEDQLHREIATMIQQEMKDPRVAMITVIAVNVTRELEQATVYVTLMGGDEASSKVPVKILNNAAGFMRRELGRRLHMRHVPALKFKYDQSIEKGNHVARLIQQARDEDDSRHATKTDGESDSD